MPIQFNEQASQAITIAAAGVHAQSATAATYLTAAVNMTLFRKVVFIADLGVLGSSATVVLSVTAAKTSGGSYTPVTGLTTMTYTQSGGTPGSVYLIVEASCQYVQQTLGNGYQFLKGSLVVGVATSPIAVIALGVCGQWEPSSLNADASLNQTICL